MRRNLHEFVWDHIRSVEEPGRVRMGAMQAFLEDFDSGRQEARYVDAELPTPPFADMSLGLAVCSHFLFLYTGRLSEAFHRAAILELCRVAPDVRIFALLALGGHPSPYVTSVVAHVRESGYGVSLETVSYEFQRGGNQMMRVRTPTGG